MSWTSARRRNAVELTSLVICGGAVASGFVDSPWRVVLAVLSTVAFVCFWPSALSSSGHAGLSAAWSSTGEPRTVVPSQSERETDLRGTDKCDRVIGGADPAVRIS
jgi:hypothetical protein